MRVTNAPDADRAGALKPQAPERERIAHDFENPARIDLGSAATAEA
jgi:hypothetical protein